MKKSFLLTLFLFFALPVFAAGEEEATILYNKGIDLYDQNKIEESIVTFKKAIAINPEFYEAYYNLARILESQKRTQEAIKTYDNLLRIAPEDYESALQYGEFLYGGGYYSRASIVLKKIPSNSEYYSRASELLVKIDKKQKEFLAASQAKAKQSLKTTLIGNVSAPSGIVVDSLGNIFVASFSENKIIKISKGTQTKSVFADNSKGVDGPIGIAIDTSDNIYVANYNKGNILKLDSKSDSEILFEAKKPYCISFDKKESKIYVTEQETNSIVSYDVSSILSKSAQTPLEVKPVGSLVETEKRVITLPVGDRNPLGTPSITESNFTRNSQSSVRAPIMVPSDSLFKY